MMGFFDTERLKHFSSKWSIERSDDFVGGAHNGSFAALSGSAEFTTYYGFPVAKLTTDAADGSAYKAGFTTAALPLAPTGSVMCGINGLASSAASETVFTASCGSYYIRLYANGTDPLGYGTLADVISSSGSQTGLVLMPTHNLSLQGSGKYNYCCSFALDRARGRIEYYCGGMLMGWYPCAVLGDFTSVTFDYTVKSASAATLVYIGQINGRAWY